MMKQSLYRALHLLRPDGRLTNIQRAIVAAIVVAVVLAVIGTEPGLPDGVAHTIDFTEFLFGILFSIEFVARLWSIGENPLFAGVMGRVRYVMQPVVIVDLIALLPFLFGVVGGESLLLRAIRVLRLLALSKMFRYSSAMRIVIESIASRKYELVFAVAIAGIMILLSSAALYLVEGAAQPRAFGSILRAMWWSVCTLTTVGYGDVVPITVLGKILAALTAIAGIGMIAMPTGILAASFSEAFARARSSSTTPQPKRQTE